MKTTTFKEMAIITTALVPILYFAYLWNSLPNIIPIHFDRLGHVNQTGSKIIMAITLLIVNLGIYITMYFAPQIGHKNNFNLIERTYFKIRLISTLFIGLISFNIINSVVKGAAEISILFSLIGILIALIGNYLSNIKPNYIIGIRTPWTLKSDYNWKKTHQFSGKVFFITGLSFAILIVFIPLEIRSYVFIGYIALIAISTFLYSYLLFKKYKHSKDTKNETNETETAHFSNDKALWFGPIYFNKNDKRIIVPKRMAAMGWTLNMAKPVSYLLIVVLITILVIIGQNYK